jgi:hypothetical protein
MTRHYSEADLLETYYTRPGQSMPVMMHLADCAECAAKYERLERKLRGIAACETERPETFWARQRISILRRVRQPRTDTVSFGRVGRVAAAAVLILVIGGVMTWRQNEPAATNDTAGTATVAVATVATASSESMTDASSSSDPWQSDELQDFQSMVAWEGWVDDTRTGDQSL